MFDDLIRFVPPVGVLDEALPLEDADAKQVLAAQARTEQWLREMGVDTSGAPTDTEAAIARDAFLKLTTAQPDDAQKAALAEIKTPPAILQLQGLLTAYDWAFVERAQEIRNYVVSKIMEETTHPDARIRLKALQMLGNVTEVAAFTERVEVTKKDVSEQELEARLRERLSRLIGPVGSNAPVEDAKVIAHEPAEPARASDLDEEIGRVAESRDASAG